MDAKLAHHAADEVAERLVDRSPVERRERLGDERGVVGRRERDVHLGGPRAEQPGHGGVRAHGLGQRGRQLLRDVRHEGPLRLGRQHRLVVRREDPLVEATELGARLLPGRTLVS